MAPFAHQMKFVLVSWLKIPLSYLMETGDDAAPPPPPPSNDDFDENETLPPILPDPFESPSRRYSTTKSGGGGGGNGGDGDDDYESHRNYELILIEDVPTFSPTTPFSFDGDVAFEPAINGDEDSPDACALYTCVEEDCCGPGTVYNYTVGECLPDEDSIGWVEWSDQYQEGCVKRACLEDECCGFGEAVGSFIQTIVYDDTLGRCVLNMEGMCMMDEAELLDLSGVNDDLEPIQEENIRRRSLQETNATKSIDYPKDLTWSDFEKDLAENDANDAYTATTQLVRKYCDGVKEGNKAYIKELSIVAVFVPKLSE
ncbi:MAG: hypothetical protein SGARI_007833, partial [Bacillariaceae sp.]